MRVSCTKAQTISTCGRLYQLRYEDRLESLMKSLALVIGRAIDTACSGYLLSHALGAPFDMKSVFDESLDTLLFKQQVRFPANWDADTARAVGHIMCDRFPEEWEKSHLVAAVDREGAPIVQRRLVVPLPNGHELEVVIDVVVMDLLTGEFAVLDLKTTSQGLSPESPFGYNAFQLTTYQYAADLAFAAFLGSMSNVGFMEMIKRVPAKTSRGKGPTVEAPRFYPRRSPEQINEMVRAYLAYIGDIQNRRFHRAINNAYNNPCDMCDFSRLCVHNDRTGITQRQSPHKAA
ncbi:MAG: hypothetical protein EA417_06970 [Gammaproteobacteria bacterium]|nr:MAG: hypothetical protein EA417_06970 [Gammaproteobacteria bacterium]